MSIDKFLKSEQYHTMKEEYEQEYFKINGDYAYYNGDKIVKRSMSNVAEQFKNKKVNVKLTFVDDEGNEKTKTISKTFYQVWSEDPFMKEYKEVVFECDKSLVQSHQFNLMDGFAIEQYEKVKPTKEMKAGVKIINEHIKSLCNYNDSHVKLVKWYIAQMLKHPESPPPVCLVFISKEGVGKDGLYELIENMLGSKYTFNTDKMDNVVGKFNSLLGGKIFGTINETDPVDSMQRRDNIKYLISAKKLEIEGKHKDPVKCKNFCRFFFFANRLIAFPVEQGSRRPYIIYCSDVYLVVNIGADKNKDYFDRLYKTIYDMDVLKLFYEELMEIDVDNFNFKEIEKSQLHQTLEDTAKPPLAEFMTELMYDHFDDKMFTMGTTEALEKFSEFQKKRNMRYETSQKNFNVELEHIYKVVKFQSCGRNKFRFHVQDIKDILLKEYKINVTKEENDDQDFEEAENMFINNDDKAEYIRVEEYKADIDKLDKKISNLKDSNECLNDDLMSALQYIKQLESRISELEKVPHKKKVDEKDFVKVADNIVINQDTGEQFEIVDDIVDDENLF